MFKIISDLIKGHGGWTVVFITLLSILLGGVVWWIVHSVTQPGKKISIFGLIEYTKKGQSESHFGSNKQIIDQGKTFQEKNIKSSNIFEVKNKISQFKANLIDGRNINISAKSLGDTAIKHNDTKSVYALWEAISETHNLPKIIDPCAYTLGRIVWEPAELTSEMEDSCFEIFKKSINTDSELIIDKFAFTIGEIVLRSRNERIRRRAKEFVNTNTLSAIPTVRDKYIYTKNRISLK